MFLRGFLESYGNGFVPFGWVIALLGASGEGKEEVVSNSFPGPNWIAETGRPSGLGACWGSDFFTSNRLFGEFVCTWIVEVWELVVRKGNWGGYQPRVFFQRFVLLAVVNDFRSAWAGNKRRRVFATSLSPSPVFKHSPPVRFRQFVAVVLGVSVVLYVRVKPFVGWLRHG